MANLIHLARLKHSVARWNTWRRKRSDLQVNLRRSSLRRFDFTGVNLRDANLRRIDFTDGVLRQADLSNADLKEANLSGVRLTLANLCGADLTQANFSGADLSAANLTGACLRSTNLSGANLQGTDLSEATLDGTILADVELTNVKGLALCHHFRPSTIDHRTLLRSGPLPLSFLRGCGLSDTLIDYLPLLLSDTPVQFYSCFISYSTKDEEFAQRLHADLQSHGVRCWFAPHDIQGGQKIHEQIDTAIRVHEKVLLILSEHSIHSAWVEFEIRRARKRELKEQKRVLFPLRLVDHSTIEQWECFDADTKKDLATEIREYFIPNFSHWKSPDAYKEALSRLLRDLKLAGTRR